MPEMYFFFIWWENTQEGTYGLEVFEARERAEDWITNNSMLVKEIIYGKKCTMTTVQVLTKVKIET
jgi:hypothetical protein